MLNVMLVPVGEVTVIVPVATVQVGCDVIETIGVLGQLVSSLPIDVKGSLPAHFRTLVQSTTNRLLFP